MSDKNFRCTIVANSKRENKKIDKSIPKFVIYLDCMHVHCLVYKFLIMDKDEDPLDVKIFSSGEFNVTLHEAIKVTRPLRGTLRNDVARELQNTSPAVYRSKTVSNCIAKPNFKTRLDFGNMESIKSKDVYKKVKSEFSKANDYHDDDLIDVFMMKEDVGGKDWIVNVANPFQINIFSSIQLDILKKFKPSILYLDATGSIVRNCKLLHLILNYC